MIGVLDGLQEWPEDAVQVDDNGAEYVHHSTTTRTILYIHVYVLCECTCVKVVSVLIYCSVETYRYIHH